MFNTLIIHPDNTQLMDKAVKLVQTGEWTHYGNRSTKVGSIPGSFLTAVTGLPMKIYFSPWSAMAVIMIFHLISYFLLRKIGFLIQENLSVLLLLLIFWLNPWRVEQSELYNPAYLFLFATLHLWTSLLMKHKNFWLTFFHVVAIGLCFQTHFSFLILALISFFMFFTGQLKVHWRGFFAGVFVVGLSLVPYVLSRYFNSAGVEENIDLAKSDAFLGRNFVLVYPVVKSLIYFFRMGSMYFGRHIFTEIQFDWISVSLIHLLVSNVFHILKWILASASLVLSFYLIGRFLKQIKWKSLFKINQTLIQNPRDRFLNYFVFTFMAVFVAASLSPVEFNHWHFILCFPVISLFMVVEIQRLISLNIYKFQISTKWIWSLVVVFILWDIFAALGSRSHSYKNDYETDFYKRYQILK